MVEYTSENKEGTALNIAHASKLFVLSFKHSQGSPYLQGMIFSYIKYIHSDWRINDDQKAAIDREAFTAIHNIARGSTKTKGYPHIDTSEAVREVSIERFLAEYQTKLAHNPTMPKDMIVKDIGMNVIKKDKLYLLDLTGRPNRSPKHSGSEFDPFFSYFQHYVIEDNVTGVAEFDQMYKDVRDIFLDDPNYQDEISEFKRIYEKKHPKA